MPHGSYLLEADGQQLSHKEGPFAHEDGGSCEPMVETSEGFPAPSLLLDFPQPVFSQQWGPLATDSH